MSSHHDQFNKNKKLNRIRSIRIFWISLPVVTMVIIGLVYVARLPSFFIQGAITTDFYGTPRNEINAQVMKYLDSYWLDIIPKKNIILFSKKNFKSWLKKEMPSISRIESTFNEERMLITRIEERTPFGVWRQNNENFFIDHSGTIYERAPSFGDGVVIIISGEPFDNPIGSSIPEIKKIQDLVLALEQLPVHVLTITIEEDITIGVDMIAELPINPDAKIIASRHYEPEVLRGVLAMLLDDAVFMKSIRDKGDQFEYLDLRTPGKMYYKFLN